MKNAEIFPELISSNQHLVAISSINIENSFVGLNNALEFCVCTILDKGSVEVKPVIPGFPGEFGNNFGSDCHSTLVWMSNGRALFTMDVLTKNKNENLIAVNGNEDIHSIQLINRNNNLLVVQLSEITGISIDDIKFHYLFYHFNDDTIVHRADNVDGSYFPFDDEKMFFSKFIDNLTRGYWYFVDLEDNSTFENELTKKMTEYNMDFYIDSKSIHAGKRVLVGLSNLNNKIIFKCFRWNESFNDVIITPLTVKSQKHIRVCNVFKFSGDGNWVKTTAEINQDDNLTQPTNIIFYSVNNIYPNGISPSVVGGLTNSNSDDAYINHTTLGPIHINLFKGNLLSYKMNDVLTILSEKAKNM